jgi:nitrite reductase/ring-hydroxylating ferredoxin subunit
MGNPTTWPAPLHEIRPGHSAKFHILWRERLVEAFVVNFGGRYYAYVNYCIHAGTPLDWWPNEFLSDEPSISDLLNLRLPLRTGFR